MSGGEETVQTLSATAKRRSLGETSKREKATKKKARVRTTVLNPREIEWPEISEEEKTELLVLIKRLIKPLKIPVRKAPLGQIRQIGKNERREFRKQWVITECARLCLSREPVMCLRSSLTLGVNCVSKGLEIDHLSAVLIEQDVNPQIITKLLVPLAMSKNVPIIAFEGLNKAFKETADMRCIAMGLKKSCEDFTNHFHPLLLMIRKLVSGEHSQEDEEDEEDEIESQPPSTDPEVRQPLYHSTPKLEIQSEPLPLPESSGAETSLRETGQQEIKPRPKKRKGRGSPAFQKAKIRRQSKSN